MDKSDPDYISPRLQKLYNYELETKRGKEGLMNLFKGLNAYVGKTKSGKTNYLQQQLIQCYYATDRNGNVLLDRNRNKVTNYPNILLFSLNQTTKLRWVNFFKKAFNREILAYDISRLEEKMAQINTLHAQHEKQYGYGCNTLIIFDDCVGASGEIKTGGATQLKNMGPLAEIATNGRNTDITAAILVQDPTLISNICYTNAVFIACFEIPNIRQRETHVFPKMLSSCDKSLPFLINYTIQERNKFFHRKMQALEAFQCIVKFDYVIEETLPSGEKYFKLVEKMYKSTAPPPIKY